MLHVPDPLSFLFLITAFLFGCLHLPGIQLSMIVAHGGKFLFPDSASYDFTHRHMTLCFSRFHKSYFNRDLPLSFLIPEPLPLPRAMRIAVRRLQYVLCIPLCRTSQFKRTFLSRTVQLWNDLPADVLQEDLRIFKQRCNDALKESDTDFSLLVTLKFFFFFYSFICMFTFCSSRHCSFYF